MGVRYRKAALPSHPSTLIFDPPTQMLNNLYICAVFDFHNKIVVQYLRHRLNFYSIISKEISLVALHSNANVMKIYLN